ncbi:unnamed protein product [Parascedosporium putredinis]|uniref:Protein transport protein sec16 n=1 Tax=Parascedosporium putredinis TaxID=1442378 RepID=A0A9P1GV07_9PEZI|nr:unnamed protein product [Parascedosporium putredinis]CAI7987539.1 unnamed protein product [Parascedosporium putredinis]
MASTDSFASWHPAFRPNTLPPDVPSTSEPSAIESDHTLVDTLPSETSFEALTKEDVTSQHVDAWFSDDVDTQNEDWLAGSEEVPVEESPESRPWEVAQSDALEASEPQPVEPQLDSDAPEFHTQEPAPEGVVTEEFNLDATSDGSAAGVETVTEATHQDEIPVLPSQGLHTEEPISDDPPMGVNAEITTGVTASESSISQEPEPQGSASQDLANNNSAEDVLPEEPERSIAPVIEQPVSEESTLQVAPDAGGEHFDTPVPEAEPERESSKQLSWEDGDAGADEGAEWFLDRSDSNDPSKFLPPAERSNSFPVVPPLDSPASPSKSYLPRTQAENLLQEEDVEGEAFFANAGSTNEDAATTRYEEGIPLISQASTQASPSNGEASASGADDAFADEDDDFFSNVVQGGGDEGLKVASEPWPLDRKSTFQAMGPRSTVSAETLSVDAIGSHNPPEPVEHPANHDEANSGETPGEGSPSGHATENSWSNEAAPVPEEDALAAKWSEAFGDDELLDDDFLGDDAAGSKEMDPAAFFGSDDEGFLDDVEEVNNLLRHRLRSPPLYHPRPRNPNAIANPYAPAVPAVPANPYLAAAPLVQPPAGYSATAPPQTTPYGVAPPPAPPSLNKAQSFADKAKGGYTSPYDLPMNVVDVKPRKRPSMQQLPSSTSIPLLVLREARASHFEKTASRTSVNGEATHGDRRTSLPHEARLHRLASLTPTREVEEEQEQSPPKPPQTASAAAASIAESRYSPVSQYAPLTAQSPRAKEHDVIPPPRSFSQSPNSQKLGLNGPAPYESPQRSVSAQAPVSPKSSQPVAPAYRWKGAPLFVWGVGGTVVSMFPKSVPRYGISQTAPMIYRTPGEVKIQHVKDVIPLEERLAKFPGPLKGKSKKKETLAWLSAGIDSLLTTTPDLAFNQTPSHEEKRSVERLLLWKTLRVLVENDGVLEGNPAVQKAVRDILMPNLDEEISPAGTSLDGVADLGALHQPGMGSVQPDALDAAGIELLRRHLLVGDREKAAWAAVDKRLWGHAMLIANTVSPELYKQVTQEFVRKEVNYAGHNNESIAALYKVLSGNHDDCVDELVPVHARAGLQLMAATTAATSMTGSLGGLDKWRESLCLILSNRSTDDSKALIALGGLLSNYGRAEAAHICFIFARQASVFGGADDPRSNFVLVGSDHRGQADRFAKDIEAILLSEVYEYGLSLAGGAAPLAPHLTGYKLQLAVTLAEYGQRDKALQYCEGALNTIGSQTKRSPYHHSALEQAMEDFVKRLKQTPREESNSWIPKPSMNKVSDTMWSTFNKFVSGEDNDSPRNGVNGDEGVESGPFAKIAGGTPTISRSPSASNFEPYGTNNAGYPERFPLCAFPPQGSAPPAITNPYEPAVAYTPRSSSEGTRHVNPYEPSRSRPSTGYQPQPQQQYNPAPAAQQGYQPSAAVPQESSYPVPAQSEPSAYPAQAPPALSSGYSPLGLQESSYNPSPAQETAEEKVSSEDQAQQGYQPPSYGYEPLASRQWPRMSQMGPPKPRKLPPSFGAEPEAGDDEPTMPKKKGPMYDDDDDGISGPTPQEKSKAEKDRENEEMVRRVAEEEEKRAAEKAAAKKGWGFGGWFGAAKKEPSPAEHPNKPGPPFRQFHPTPRTDAGTPPPLSGLGRASAPPGGPPRPGTATGVGESTLSSHEGLGIPTPMARSVSNQSAGGPPSGPPSRPTTSMSNASSIDDLIGAAAPRKHGQKKARKSGRYVDVMAQ